MPTKKLTISERVVFTLNYIKNFMFIITPLTVFLGYVTTLIVKDTDWYKEERELFKWYENKQKSFAVGLRVDEKGQIWYKATDKEMYRAIYSDKGAYFYYVDSKGKTKECH